MGKFAKSIVLFGLLLTLSNGTHSHGLWAQTQLPAIQFEEDSKVLVCANCMREVSGSAANGQKCPYCGVIWDASGAIPILPPQPASPVDSDPPATDPAAANAPPQQPVAAPAPGPQLVPQPAGQGAPMAPAANLGMPEEMNMANLPVWMKVGCFVGSVAALYYLFLYRR